MRAHNLAKCIENLNDVNKHEGPRNNLDICTVWFGLSSTDSIRDDSYLSHYGRYTLLQKYWCGIDLLCIDTDENQYASYTFQDLLNNNH